MTLSAQALTTLAAAREVASIAIGPDAYLEALIERASERVARLCNRTLHYVVDGVDAVPGWGDYVLSVPRAPLVSVSSIVLKGLAGSADETVDQTAYAIESAARGELRRIDGAPWAWTGPYSGIDPMASGTPLALYEVTYTGGFVTPQQVIDDGTLERNLPDDLEAAVLEIVKAGYKSTGRDPALASMRNLSASLSYRAADAGISVLGTELRAMLAPYRWEAVA